MLHIHDLTVVFRQGTSNELRALDQLSCTIAKGDFVTIVGSNGAGKSTLLNAIHGVFPTPRGTILLDGEDISMQKQHVRSRSIGRLYQDPMMGSAAHMSVMEHISMASHAHPFSLAFGVHKQEERKAKELLACLQLGLEEQLHAEVGTLSGGQRQALSLLLATRATPKLLLLDEHTAALDPLTAKTIMQLTEQCVAQHQITTLMITHDMKQALQYGNKLLVMNQGKISAVIDQKQKQELTLEKLLAIFEQKEIVISDRMI